MRVGVIGTGGVARRHLGVLHPLPAVEIVGHVSQGADRARSQALEWGGRPFTRIEDLLKEARPEAVWICVTPDGHGHLEETLIEHGIPFFVEKPLSVDLATAERIARRLQEASAIMVGVGYKFRALDTLVRARELLAERPPRLVHAIWHDRMPPPVWWHQASRSGGQVVEQATHLLDLARVLIGEAEVVGSLSERWPRADVRDSDVPDVTLALLEFNTASGRIPGMVSATSLLRGHPRIELELVCEGRVLHVSERHLTIDYGTRVEEMQTQVDPFLVEDRAFVQAVLTGDAAQVLCSYADALESHRLACRIRGTLRVATPTMTDAFQDLSRSEHLLEAADAAPERGREAAVSALRGLLEEWGGRPRADSVVGLLEQAAETDARLLDLRSEAAVLDRFSDEPDSLDRAREFVDAVRARLVNI
jgi:predicted dehydrogenase